jgi:mono/diheme cytochrome c family protein
MRWSVSVVSVLVLAVPACAVAQPPDGRAVFEAQCVPCHQAGGKGVPGNFPPLAGNADIFLARDFPARVVLFGLSGKIHVRGQTIDGAMPPLGELLKDGEVAAVVNYVRSAFGNDRLRPKDMAPVDAATVAGLRGQKGTDDTFGYRARLKAAAAQKR